MVTLRELPVSSSGIGEGSGSGSGAGQLDDQMRDFISAEITGNIIDQTPVIFGSVREAIVELMGSHLKALGAGAVSGQFGAHLEPDSHGSQGSIRKGSPIFSTCHPGSGVSGPPYPQEGSLQDWIAAEVSRALQEELPNTIGRITDSVVDGIERRTSAVQAMGEMVTMTHEREIGSDSQLRKRKRSSGLVRQDGQSDTVVVGVRGPQGRDSCTREKGARAGVRSKSKCGRCGWKGHKRQECTVEVELCHRCHQPGHVRVNCPVQRLGQPHCHSRVRKSEGLEDPSEQVAGMILFLLFYYSQYYCYVAALMSISLCVGYYVICLCRRFMPSAYHGIRMVNWRSSPLDQVTSDPVTVACMCKMQ